MCYILLSPWKFLPLIKMGLGGEGQRIVRDGVRDGVKVARAG